MLVKVDISCLPRKCPNKESSALMVYLRAVECKIELVLVLK